MSIKKSTASCRLLALSFDRKNLFRGYYLLVTDDGQEYIMRRHFSLSSKSPRHLYQSSISLKQFIVTDKNILLNKNGKQGLASFIALCSGALVMNFIPKSFLFGPANSPFSFLQAIINLLIVAIVGFLFITLLIGYRDLLFRYFIKKQGGVLSRLGSVKAKEPYRYSSIGREYW